MANQLNLFDDCAPRSCAGELVGFPMALHKSVATVGERYADVRGKRLETLVTRWLDGLYNQRIGIGLDPDAVVADLEEYARGMAAARDRELERRTALAARSALIVDFETARTQRGGMPPAAPTPAGVPAGETPAARRRRSRTNGGWK